MRTTSQSASVPSTPTKHFADTAKHVPHIQPSQQSCFADPWTKFHLPKSTFTRVFSDGYLSALEFFDGEFIAHGYTDGKVGVVGLTKRL